MDELFQNLRYTNLRRTDDGIIGGVCAGIAHRWGISPILVRLAFLCLLLFGGITFLLYGIAWFLIPKFPSDQIELEDAIHGAPNAATAGALAFILLGVFTIFSFGENIFGAFASFTLIVVPGIVLLSLALFLIFRKQRNKNGNTFTSQEFSQMDQNNSAQTQPSQQLQAQHSPRVSGRFVLTTLAVVLASAALTLALMPTSYGSWAVTAGVVSTGLGLAVTIAGAMGKRATWLTAFTWLAAFPTVCAIFFALTLPHAVVTSENTRSFVMDHHFIPRTASQQENIAQPSLIQSYTYNVTADYPRGNSKITTGLAAGINFSVPDDQPVIFKIDTTGFGHIGFTETLQEWEIQYRGETFKTQLPTIYQPRAAEYKKLLWSYDGYNLDPREQLIATSPAAIADPSKARVIEIEFGFGEIKIGADAPNSLDPLKYAEETLKVPQISEGVEDGIEDGTEEDGIEEDGIEDGAEISGDSENFN